MAKTKKDNTVPSAAEGEVSTTTEKRARDEDSNSNDEGKGVVELSLTPLIVCNSFILPN
jgi:hypothetical protein